MRTRNVAARAAHWSAQHRKIAVFGWIGFVVIAVLVGSSAGTKTIKDENSGNGDSRTAAQIIARSGLKDRATEQVLIQSRGSLSIADPQFQATVLDVQHRVARAPYVIQLTSPLTPSGVGQISHDQRSALVIFQIAG